MTHIKKKPLIRKTSAGFIWISLVLICLSTVALFFYVSNLLKDEVEEELRSTEARIENQILKEGTFYQLPPVVSVEITEQQANEKLKDTLIFDPSQNEMEEFRELVTYADLKEKNYKITVRSLIVESDSILFAVVISYLVIIAMVFLFLFYLNKATNKKTWNPFFKNLNAMKYFSLASDTSISLMDSDVLEFSELNREIETLTKKVRSDYKNLKQYTEDVSHEIQTPLAIIQAKIENIINDEHLNDEQFEQLSSIQNDVQRLTQLNKRLALLSKIENQQFSNAELLQLNHVVKERVQNFSELFPNQIEIFEEERVFIQMDKYLLDILCDNLISNALKYGGAAKKVAVWIKDSHLFVSNYGEKSIQNPELLFKRFYKESSNKKSMGLGLAIVKKICDSYAFRVSYVFVGNSHVFKVYFDLENTTL